MYNNNKLFMKMSSYTCVYMLLPHKIVGVKPTLLPIKTNDMSRANSPPFKKHIHYYNLIFIPHL